MKEFKEEKELQDFDELIASLKGISMNPNIFTRVFIARKDGTYYLSVSELSLAEGETRMCMETTDPLEVDAFVTRFDQKPEVIHSILNDIGE